MQALYAKQKTNLSGLIGSLRIETAFPEYQESKYSVFQQKKLFYKLDFISMIDFCISFSYR